MIKYTVASATIVFNIIENRRFAAPEYANQRIRTNAERSIQSAVGGWQRRQAKQLTEKGADRVGNELQTER